VNAVVPRTRTARSVRLAVVAALLSMVAHAAFLGVTPWFAMSLPDDVLARELVRTEEEPDEAIFFLDLRTTTILAPEVPPALVIDPGEPDVPVDPAEDVAEMPVAEDEPAPETTLESAALADADAPAQELAPVVEAPPDPPPEPVAAAPILVDETETAPLETAPAHASAGVARRSDPSSASALVAIATSFAAGALAGPSGTPPAGNPAARTGAPDPGEGDATFAPRLLDAPKPEYPDACRRRRIEGTVLCRMHVKSDGRVERVDVVESSNDERLDRAAVRALERWRFDPPRRAGVAISSKVLHRVSFRLR